MFKHLGLRLVELFGEIKEPLEGRVLLEEVYYDRV